MKITIEVGLHKFTLSCSDAAEEKLIARAAANVNKRIHTLRQQTQTSDYERATLKAALLIAIEGEKGHNRGTDLPQSSGDSDWSAQLNALVGRIDDELKRSEDLVFPQGRNT